jgi:hypothetical protein
MLFNTICRRTASLAGEISLTPEVSQSRKLQFHHPVELQHRLGQ